ncbi:MAG: ureidoglycolate lyase [Proteobacteria bacterium]|nr:ureidoglycolate lyase [Pseudomonadota bacterium]
MNIVVRPMDASAFAPFGQVLESPGEANRLDHAAAAANLRDDAKINVCLVRALPLALPHKITDMERHAFSSQAFFPLNVARYLVMVAPPADGDMPDMTGLQAFSVAGHQAINYNAGTWHHPLATLEGPGEFAVLMWEDGGDRDTDWSKVSEDVTVVLE